jgi:hypothetical protein
MPWVIPGFERAKTVHVIDRAANVYTVHYCFVSISFSTKERRLQRPRQSSTLFETMILPIFISLRLDRLERHNSNLVCIHTAATSVAWGKILFTDSFIKLTVKIIRNGRKLLLLLLLMLILSFKTHDKNLFRTCECERERLLYLSVINSAVRQIE